MSVSVPAGSIKSFFIYTPNKIRYTKGTTEGSLFSKDDMLEIYEGVGVRSKFAGSRTEDIFSPRVFTGTIR